MTIETILSSLSSPRPDDARERVSLQACPADQSPVNIGLRHERVNILVVDAAAIDNPDRIGALAPVTFEYRAADCAVYCFGLLGRCGASGTNRPHRLVRNHDAGDMIIADVLEPALKLTQHDIERAPAVVFVLSFADAHYRGHPVMQSGEHLLVNQLV